MDQQRKTFEVPILIILKIPKLKIQLLDIIPRDRYHQFTGTRYFLQNFISNIKKARIPKMA